MSVNSRRAEGGLPPCAGIEAEHFQRVDLFFTETSEPGAK